MSEVGEAEGDVAPEAAPEPERRHGALVTASAGQTVLHLERERYLEVVDALQAEGFNLCSDVTAVDYLTFGGNRGVPAGVVPERFEVVVNLTSLRRRQRVRLRVQVPAGDPTLPSLFSRYPGTEGPEREVYDMFGIVFLDHPDLTRILMPEDWEGHPLRKDYGVGRIPVQFKAAPGDR
jgi:NADH-quinone oxidoreductase subunit C